MSIISSNENVKKTHLKVDKKKECVFTDFKGMSNFRLSRKVFSPLTPFSTALMSFIIIAIPESSVNTGILVSSRSNIPIRL